MQIYTHPQITGSLATRMCISLEGSQLLTIFQCDVIEGFNNIALARTKTDRFYIYIKPILLARACTVVHQTENGCNNNTVDNTNTNDRVYKIYKDSRD